ncbi:cytochrome P460 family protein [Arenibacter sp. GZD96]|uniref:cytochrome P460 family protein n=1 Tax=Aurantibrevibacter litoralis TaxID=3106030 RepID=UPI002AFF3A57|nr:cytochrome P460 family protein [Arenibacter sp. GZD-96]MEA1787349.1 cytochrome P460 family protein [Arenibacter sp. GZD-96]
MKKVIFVIGTFVIAATTLVTLQSFNTPKELGYVAVADETLDLDPRWENYQSWYHVTKDNPNTGDPTGFLGGKHSGTKAYREIYINEIGEAGHKAPGDTNKYAPGTVIVKEAFKNEKSWQEKKKPVLTVMVKLNPGESPETNDWGYVMGEKGSVSTGTSKWAKFCNGCHVFAAGKDNAFVNSAFLQAEN